MTPVLVAPQGPTTDTPPAYGYWDGRFGVAPLPTAPVGPLDRANERSKKGSASERWGTMTVREVLAETERLRRGVVLRRLLGSPWYLTCGGCGASGDVIESASVRELSILDLVHRRGCAVAAGMQHDAGSR